MVRIGQNQMSHCCGLGYIPRWTHRYIDDLHAEFLSWPT